MCVYVYILALSEFVSHGHCLWCGVGVKTHPSKWNGLM